MPSTAPETLSLHDALPIYVTDSEVVNGSYIFTAPLNSAVTSYVRSEEHTSELQSRFDLVCRLLLEKQNAARRIVQLPSTARLDTVAPAARSPRAAVFQLPL